MTGQIKCGSERKKKGEWDLLPTVCIAWDIFCGNGGMGMAEELIVVGGRPLFGTVQIPAAKNSVLPLLAASILCSGRVILQDVPELADVENCRTLLKGVGCPAEWQGTDLVVDSRPCSGKLDETAAARMRASILFCAPLLARLGRAETVLPGGCRIGARPIDLHLAGLEQMGVKYTMAGPEKLVLFAPAGLHGARITLPFASVGATETLILAAATAQGETVLQGAAKEPEIEDLACFLNRCGADIQGAGTELVRIRGKRVLSGGVFRPAADRIVASTLACACAAAGGQVTLQGCDTAWYEPLLATLERMGCRVERRGRTAVIARFGQLRGAGTVCTGGYPELATDAGPLLAAVMLCAQGESCIRDRIFERRFACAEGFAALGAKVHRQGCGLWVEPGGMLRGTKLEATDLRGGAALVIAALAACGQSRIAGVEHIDRGYGQMERMLAGLGAQISRETTAKQEMDKKRISKKQNHLAIGAKR